MLDGDSHLTASINGTLVHTATPPGLFNILGVLYLQFTLPCHHFVNYSADLSLDGGDQTIPLNIEETMAVLTRCSFDEYLRQPIFMLGGIRAIAELIQVSLFMLLT